jgi:predicted transcriptional regulator
MPIARTITVDDETSIRLQIAMAGLYPIPMIPDPSFTAPVDNPDADAPQVPQYDGNDWVVVCMQKWAQAQINRWEARERIDAAKAAIIPVPPSGIVVSDGVVT